MAIPTRDSKQGGWHVQIQVTVNGRTLRRHIRGRTKNEVQDAADTTRAELRAGALPDRGKTTVGQWLESWITARETAGTVRRKTIAGYRSDAKHISRVLGRIRLDKLTPEMVEDLYADLKKRKHNPGGILHVRRTLSACLNTAVKRGRLGVNPVTLAEAPKGEEEEIDPLTPDEVHNVLAVSGQIRNGVRWVLALSTGMRQGEVLAMQWNDIDWELKTLDVCRSLGRIPWRHGCEPDRSCGRKPQHCPHGIRGGLVAGSLKTRAGRRAVALPDQVMRLLEAHRRAQAAERLRAGEMWQAGPRGGWVFASAVGTPIDPRNDQRQWKRVLKQAGVRPMRVHDARHTAATIALVSGTDSRVLQGIFGWSSPALVARYAHVVDEAKRQAAARMGAALWPQQGACLDQDVDEDTSIRKLDGMLQRAYAQAAAEGPSGEKMVQRLSAHAAARIFADAHPDAKFVDLDWGPSGGLEPVAVVGADGVGRAPNLEAAADAVTYTSNLVHGGAVIASGGSVRPYVLDIDKALGRLGGMS